MSCITNALVCFKRIVEQVAWNKTQNHPEKNDFCSAFKCIELLTEGCVGVAAGGLVWKGRAVRTDGSSGTSNYFLQAVKPPDVMWISLNPSSVHTGIKHSDVFKSGSLFLLGHVLIGTQYKYKRLSHSQKPEWLKKDAEFESQLSCHLFTLVSFQMHKLLFFLHATQRRISHAR